MKLEYNQTIFFEVSSNLSAKLRPSSITKLKRKILINHTK